MMSGLAEELAYWAGYHGVVSVYSRPKLAYLAVDVS